MSRLSFNRAIVTATLLMVGYTVFRAAIVWGTLDSYEVNPWVFLALDVFTAPPYVWGIGKMIQGIRGVDSLKMVYVGGVIAILSFLAPYVYLYVAGHTSMPVSTKIIIAGIITLLFVAGPLREVVKKVKIGKACDAS